MSSTTKDSSSKPTDTSSNNKDTKETTQGNPHLGILEEDDEFEEFPVADWDDSQTDLANLGATAPGAPNSGGDELWEDNWDDDDIEPEFSMQLRNELQKTGNSDSMEQ